jgi:hypothetical protein
MNVKKYKIKLASSVRQRLNNTVKIQADDPNACWAALKDQCCQAPYLCRPIRYPDGYLNFCFNPFTQALINDCPIMNNPDGCPNPLGLSQCYNYIYPDFFGALGSGAPGVQPMYPHIPLACRGGSQVFGAQQFINWNYLNNWQVTPDIRVNFYNITVTLYNENHQTWIMQHTGGSLVPFPPKHCWVGEANFGLIVNYVNESSLDTSASYPNGLRYYYFGSTFNPSNPSSNEINNGFNVIEYVNGCSATTPNLVTMQANGICKAYRFGIGNYGFIDYLNIENKPMRLTMNNVGYPLAGAGSLNNLELETSYPKPIPPGFRG